jgi:hypothetical protein
MTNSAARGGGHFHSPGGVGRIGYGAKPMAGVSSCVLNSRHAGGTHEPTLADTPQGGRTERRCTTVGCRLPVPSAMGDGGPRRHVSCAITPAGGVPWKSPCMSVSRPPVNSKRRRLTSNWPGFARMWRPSRIGSWPRHTSTAMTAIAGPSCIGRVWIGGGIGPPWPSSSGSC